LGRISLNAASVSLKGLAVRRLFSERGYFATKVDDIAALARVVPATVYAVSGGKKGLLRTLTETANTDPAIEAAIGSIEKLDDPSAILRLVAATGAFLNDYRHLNRR
jgi:AcrR family transcriptional regulator